MIYILIVDFPQSSQPKKSLCFFFITFEAILLCLNLLFLFLLLFKSVHCSEIKIVLFVQEEDSELMLLKFMQKNKINPKISLFCVAFHFIFSSAYIFFAHKRLIGITKKPNTINI